MSSSYGDNFRMTIFGQSHSIGVTMEGIPAGETLDMDELQRFLSRRAPGQNKWSTARSEADLPEFVSGLKGDTTCGAPLTALIRNTDARSRDSSSSAHRTRPAAGIFPAVSLRRCVLRAAYACSCCSVRALR